MCSNPTHTHTGGHPSRPAPGESPERALEVAEGSEVPVPAVLEAMFDYPSSRDAALRDAEE